MLINLIDVAETHIIEGGLHSQLALFGRTAQGQTVCAFVHDVPHYIYVAVAASYSYAALRDTLNKYLVGRLRFARCNRTGCECKNPKSGGSTVAINSEPCITLQKCDKQVVLGIDRVLRNSALGYEAAPRLFLRIRLLRSTYASSARAYLQKLDTGLPPLLRMAAETCSSARDAFMRNKNAAGFGWLEIRENRPAHHAKYRSRARHEFNVLYSEVLVSACTDVAPVPTTLCLDIETLAEKRFSDNDPICMVACKSEHRRVVHVLMGGAGEVDWPDRGGWEVELHPDEPALLRALCQTILDADPDFITGYNSNKFDLPRILRRCGDHGVAMDVSRLKGEPLRVQEVVNESNQSGAMSNTLVDCPGRAFLDGLLLIKASMKKRRSYALKRVAIEEGLDNHKDDVEYSEIHGLHHGSAQDRGRLAKYICKDVDVTAELITKRKMVLDLMAACQVKRLVPRDALTRGQNYCFARSLRDVMGDRFVIPDYPKNAEGVAIPEIFRLNPALMKLTMDKKYDGAHVFDPICALHRDLVMVFDFNSLYPTTMIANNLCFSTFVPSLEYAQSQGLTEADLTLTPAGYYFVKASVRKGLLPMLAERLLAERKAVKAEMERVPKGSALWHVLNARQNALKVMANSLYGLLGAITSAAGNRAVALSVTTYGKKYIIAVSEYIKAHFPSTECIYGDTDSVFIKAVGLAGTLEERIRLARELGHAIMHKVNNESGIFERPMKLALEKLVDDMLLMGKKKYAGCKYDAELDADLKPELMVSGLESVRRDNALFVARAVGTLLRKMLVEHASDGELVEFCRGEMERLVSGRITLTPEAEAALAEDEARVAADKLAGVAGAPPLQLETLLDNPLCVTPAQLVKSQNISQPIEKYKGRQAHVEVARQLIAAGFVVEPGDRVEYVYVHAESKKKADKACAAKLLGERHIDLDEYVKALRDPILRCLEFVLSKEKLRSLFNPENYERNEPSGRGGAIVAYLTGGPTEKFTTITPRKRLDLSGPELREATLDEFFRPPAKQYKQFFVPPAASRDLRGAGRTGYLDG
jgi:DNA polymerase delta subunit 1